MRFFGVILFIFISITNEKLELSLARASDVCSSCLFTTLQSAIEAAKDNDIIQVHPGRYSEGRIVINKPVQLLAKKGAVLAGQPDKPGFIIYKTKGVVIRGFRIENTGQSYTEEMAGIRVIESENCILSENEFWNTNFAIYLEKATGCTVSHNKITGFAKTEAGSGNGIHLWTGTHNLISGNHIQGHRDGIYLEFAQDNVIQKNWVEGNIRYGLHFMSSNNTTYEGNTFTRNGAGVAVMYSHHITMKKNVFSENKGPAAYGLLLKEIRDSAILQNSFSDNTIGIYMEGSNRSQFQRNTIANSGWGLRIMGDCEGNQFQKNSFINNSFEITSNADHSWNEFNNNYWSRYDGYDIDKDGVGDVPHFPVRFSSVLLEKVDSTYILLGSFLFQLLDSVEKAFPEFTPVSIKDANPLLTPMKVTDESGS